MTPVCKAVTKDAPQAFNPRVAHACRNQVWADGYCKVHHPVLRLARLTKKRTRLAKGLAAVDAEIDVVKATGVQETDIPGQLRMFEQSRQPEPPALFATA